MLKPPFLAADVYALPMQPVSAVLCIAIRFTTFFASDMQEHGSRHLGESLSLMAFNYICDRLYQAIYTIDIHFD
jgi:hypothetical protein